MRLLPLRHACLRLRRRPLVVCLAAVLCAPPALADRAQPAGGGNLVVTTCDDSGTGSLRDVVASAHSGDTIDLSGLDCGLITLTSGPIAIADDDGGQPIAALDLIGPGSATLTIDGGATDRIFDHEGGAAGALSLSGLTLMHGSSGADGGCVLAQGSINFEGVAISDCVVDDSPARAHGQPAGTGPLRGGAVFVGADATLTDSTISGSRVHSASRYTYGGGLFAVGTVTLTSSTIENNTAQSVGGGAYGGGIATGDRAGHLQATLTMTSSIVTGNTADSSCGFCGARGGGAWVYGNSTLSDGEFSGNGAVSDYGYGTGGGLYFTAHYGGAPVSATVTGTHFHCNSANNGGGIGAAGDLAIARAILDCNNATADGGAIELFGGNLTLTDSSLVGNIAGGGGGGIFMFGYGDVATSNSTISGNVATNGGGIGNTYGSLHLANSTIAFNQAFEHGGGVYQRYAYYPFDLQSTIVAGNTGAAGPEDLWPPGMTVSGSNDLVVAADGVDLPADTLSADPLLEVLTSNGGTTLTHALGKGSPAIDTGNNDAALEFDQRGQGFVRVYGAAADIGAFEVQPVSPPDTIFHNGFDP